jgi:hypothetical protein
MDEADKVDARRARDDAWAQARSRKEAQLRIKAREYGLEFVQIASRIGINPTTFETYVMNEGTKNVSGWLVHRKYGGMDNTQDYVLVLTEANTFHKLDDHRNGKYWSNEGLREASYWSGYEGDDPNEPYYSGRKLAELLGEIIAAHRNS